MHTPWSSAVIHETLEQARSHSALGAAATSCGERTAKRPLGAQYLFIELTSNTFNSTCLELPVLPLLYLFVSIVHGVAELSFQW